MFRKYFDSQSQSQSNIFVKSLNSFMNQSWHYEIYSEDYVHVNDISALKHAYKHGEPE
jgi:hypothetical protein